MPYDPTELGFDPIQTPAASQPAPQAARSKIESLMTAHPALFNDKHRAWVIGRFESTGGPDAQKRMLGYVEKTIRNAVSAAPNHSDPVF